MIVTWEGKKGKKIFKIRNKVKEGRSFGNTLKRKEGRSLGYRGSISLYIYIYIYISILIHNTQFKLEYYELLTLIV